MEISGKAHENTLMLLIPHLGSSLNVVVKIDDGHLKRIYCSVAEFSRIPLSYPPLTRSVPKSYEYIITFYESNRDHLTTTGDYIGERAWKLRLRPMFGDIRMEYFGFGVSLHSERSNSGTPDQSSPNVENLPKIPNRDKIVELMKDSRKRFLLELEFVELLASPLYLERLAKLKYFSDPRFIRFRGQATDSEPFLSQQLDNSYPYCLYFLELLQKKEFRDKLVDPQYVALLYHQQYLHWRHHKHLRMRELYKSFSSILSSSFIFIYPGAQYAKLEFERQKEENKGDSNPTAATANQSMPALEQVST
eukprot:jgi/Bigna1/91577/estExt_fgenesh1_pg.C_1070043